MSLEVGDLGPGSIGFELLGQVPDDLQLHPFDLRAVEQADVGVVGSAVLVGGPVVADVADSSVGASESEVLFHISFLLYSVDGVDGVVGLLGTATP